MHELCRLRLFILEQRAQRLKRFLYFVFILFFLYTSINRHFIFMLTKSFSRSSKESSSRDSKTSGSIRSSNHLPWLIAAVLVLVAGLAALWYVPMYLSQKKASASPERVALNTDQVQSLVQKVAAHIQVKDGEQPTVATIQDVEILRAQNPDFYKDAQNGDRLLIWSDKAVLYSSSQDKLLAVLPIRIPETPAATGTTSQNPTPTAPKAPVAENATIDVRNATQVSGLAKTVADRLTASGLKVGQVASTKASADTLIVVQPGKSYPETVKKLAELTGGRVATLPAGEASFSSDIVVLVGANYKK